jgi:hypothetical protein
MSSLTVDLTEARKTWKAIEVRMSHSPTQEVVGEDALATIEEVVMERHDEAYDLYPTNSFEDRIQRIQFWKQAVIGASLPAKAGIMAVYFHEYVAASLRGQSAAPVPTVFTDDEPGRIPSYGGERRAQHDAWVACTASLR